MTKLFAEALSKSVKIDLELYYMLLGNVEFVRQYNTYECQMIPTTFHRAFDVRSNDVVKSDASVTHPGSPDRKESGSSIICWRSTGRNCRTS